RLRGERITETVDRANELWFARIVAKGVAQLCDDSGQRRVGDVYTGPDQIVKVHFRDGLRRALEQHTQQLVSFLRDVDLVAAGEQQAPVGIELKAAEEERHGHNYGVRRLAAAMDCGASAPLFERRRGVSE